mmetsp:Transcript_42786/g.110333  ORF Transcript_42786/g.110333 Transcript_42786/m.110333 type:complete len:228 (+) Transcript_42786:1145-1828(+)
MRATNKLQSVDVVELFSYLRAEQPPCTTWRYSPRLNVFWVRPHQIAEWPFVRDLLLSLDEAHLINCLDIRGQATVHAQHSLIHHRGDREIVKHFRAVLPSVRVSVLPHALIVKAIHLSNLPRFVVASDQSDLVWVPGFQQHEVGKRLQAVVTPVHKVTHENVVCFRHRSSCFEQVEEIMKLTVYVTANGHGGSYRLHVRLLHQLIFHNVAYLLQLIFVENFALFYCL